MAKKEGDLRLLKNGVVFGPTNREGLDRMLAAGRIAPSDHVSVLNAEWMTIADFLAGTPPKETPPAADMPASEGGPKKGDLRVLSGGRVVGSLTRGQVEQLCTARRVGDDDLISAVDGPWMRVGDFFSTSSPPPQSSDEAPRRLPQSLTTSMWTSF